MAAVTTAPDELTPTERYFISGFLQSCIEELKALPEDDPRRFTRRAGLTGEHVGKLARLYVAYAKEKGTWVDPEPGQWQTGPLLEDFLEMVADKLVRSLPDPRVMPVSGD